MRTDNPNPKGNKPAHEGRTLKRANLDRSCQITKAENNGTKKP
jgi:hypothetical protein